MDGYPQAEGNFHDSSTM